MPFSLARTCHVFLKTATGGIQKVIAKNPGDGEQINLIRGHLMEMVNDFKLGDFSDPIKIHGEQMPGLAELTKAQPKQLKIQYQELPQGGQISYSAKQSRLIHAIHHWFDAQLSDHAHHAMSNHRLPAND